jgi:hypothetical protein
VTDKKQIWWWAAISLLLACACQTTPKQPNFPTAFEVQTLPPPFPCYFVPHRHHRSQRHLHPYPTATLTQNRESHCHRYPHPRSYVAPAEPPPPPAEAQPRPRRPPNPRPSRRKPRRTGGYPAPPHSGGEWDIEAGFTPGPPLWRSCDGSVLAIVGRFTPGDHGSSCMNKTV